MKNFLKDPFHILFLIITSILLGCNIYAITKIIKNDKKYVIKTTYTKVSEPRFSVHYWDSDEWPSPSLGWWHDRGKTLTLSQLIKPCAKQVCTISNLYIRPGDSRPTTEIYTVNELRQILQSPDGTIKKFDGLNGFVIDLRKP